MRKRGVVAGLVVVLMVLGAVAAARIRLNADFVSYLRADNPLVEAYYHVGEVFGGNEAGVVLVEAADVYQPDVLSLIASLTEAYSASEEVAYATSLSNTLEFKGTQWGIEIGQLVSPDGLPTTDAQIAALRERIQANPRLAGNLVSEDGTLAVVHVRLRGGRDHPPGTLEANVRQVVSLTEDILRREGVSARVGVHFGGLPFVMFNVSRQISQNMAVLVPLMLAFLIAALYVGFRHWTGVVYPLAVVLASSAAVLGAMGLLGLSLDLLSGLVPVVLMVLGSADGIHFMKRFYERRSEGDSAPVAASQTYRETRTPLVLTTLTTMVGFGSLAISNVVIIRQFGLLTAFGLLVALAVTLLLLPALASYGAGTHFVKRPDGGGRLGVAWTRLVSRHAGSLLIAGLAVTLVAAHGSHLIERSVDWTLCLEEGSPPRRAELLLRDKMGGSLPVQLQVQGDLLDPATLRVMRAAERRLDAIPSVGNSQSLAGLLAEMNHAVNGWYAVPASRAGAANLWLLIEDEEAVDHLVRPGDVTEGLVQGRVSDWETGSIRAAVDGIGAWPGVAASSWAVVDSRRLPVEARRSARAAGAADLRDQLAWEFEAQGAEAPDGLLALSRAFFQWTPDAGAEAELRAAVLTYLESDEAEVRMDARAATRLASRLAGATTVWGVPGETVDAFLSAEIPGLGEADRADLAQSLELVTFESMGRARVASTGASLATMEPGSAQEGRLQRNLLGSLWEAHSPLLVVESRRARGWDLGGDALVRDVPVAVRRSGLTSVLEQMEGELLPTQIQSLLLTTVLVLAFLSFIFRSAVAGALAVLPLLVAVVVNFGALGYLRLGLDSFTAMVAAIAIGVGVDYAIHFTHRLRREVRESAGDLPSALAATLQTSGVAILINTVSVGAGFLVLLAATCQHVRRFGGLTALAMFVAGLSTLMLLPALYLKLRPRFLGLRPAPGTAAASSRKQEPLG